MLNEQRLRYQITELQKHWKLLSEKLSRLEHDRILETHAEERFRIDQRIKESKTERQELEKQLSELETQLSSVMKTETDESIGRKDDRDQLSISSVIDYNKTILNMTSHLRQLRDYSNALHLEQPLIDAIDEVIRRAETSRFSIAVVGEFKRGKSTFINALLGKEILPSDVLPTTATLNRVTYGAKPMAKIIYKEGREEEIGVDQLSEYVTKLSPESESVAANIKQAEVYYPLEILRENIDIFDTPGLNDEATMTEVTLSVLPRIDAAILVIMPEAPFDMYEQEFLNKLLTNDLGRVIFIITAIDRKRPEERQRIIDGIVDRIKQTITKRAERLFGRDTEEYNWYLKRIGAPKIFGLSGLQALEAKLRGDNALLERSHFPRFMKALEQFLTQERGVIVLRVIVDRVLKSSIKILEKIGIQQGALRMQQDEFNKIYDAALVEIKTLREKQRNELAKIDDAIINTKQKVHPLLNQLEGELKEAAGQVIDAASVSPSDLKKANRDAFMEKIARKVSEGVQNAGKILAEKIQMEIQRELVTEATRLQAFSISVEEVLHRIEMQFVNIEADSTRQETTAAEGLAAALAVVTGFGGIWSGYRQAGGKGAAVGGVASFGTAFGAGLILGILGLPITWPVVIVTGVVSIFTGGWLTKKIFGGDVVEDFKKNYNKQVLEEITKQLQSQPIEQTVGNYITDSFEALKHKVKQEVETALDQTQKNLDDLSQQREQKETITESDLAELEKMSIETQKIFANAQWLNDRLIEIMNI